MAMKRRIKRTIDFRYKLICFWCATGEIQYESRFSNVHDEKIKDEGEWKEGLTIWGDNMRPGLAEFLERAAKQKCKKYGRAESICWRYDVEEPGFQFGEEIILVYVPEVLPEVIPEVIPEVKEKVPTLLPRIETGIIEAINAYEVSAKSLSNVASKIADVALASGLEKQAIGLNESARILREKYGLIGKEL